MHTEQQKCFLLIYITSKDSFKFFAIRRVVYTYTTTRLSNYAPLEKKTRVCVCVCVCVNSNRQVLTFSIKTEASCSETSFATVFSPGPPYVAVRALVTATAATASAIYNRQLVSARLAS